MCNKVGGSGLSLIISIQSNPYSFTRQADRVNCSTTKDYRIHRNLMISNYKYLLR